MVIALFVLSRRQVLKQLPAKEELVEFCPMSTKQQQLYGALLSKLKGATNGESEWGKGGKSDLRREG